jgi:gamma-glutamyltranspeptidase
LTKAGFSGGLDPTGGLLVGQMSAADAATFFGTPIVTVPLGASGVLAVPQERLGSRDYAEVRGADIDPSRATPSASLPRGLTTREGGHTTHFSVVDAAGNRVAATLSINAPFGAAFVAGGTGVLLNNEMNDFAIAPDVANMFGLTGDAANAIAPGKRPLSSMSPTFVEDTRGVLVLGTPGGSRIISMLLLAIQAHIDNRVPDIDAVLATPRYHHQYLPDRVEIEPGQFGADWVQALTDRGHVVQEGRRRWGNMQAVFVDAVTGEVTAHGDPRTRAGGAPSVHLPDQGVARWSAAASPALTTNASGRGRSSLPSAGSSPRSASTRPSTTSPMPKPIAGVRGPPKSSTSPS